MNVAFPLYIDASGRTAIVDQHDYIKQLIEQVLFTMPGERVNQPDFGSGLMQMVFAANNMELLTTSEFLVKGALQKWLGDLIRVQEVQVKAEEAILKVVIAYQVNMTQEQQVAEFSSPFNIISD